MVVHSSYPDDPRVRRETEALLDDGWMVDVICLRGNAEPPAEQWGGATVYRLPVRRHRGSGLAVYVLEYLSFFLLASLHLSRLHLRRRYDVVQVHNMPDFLVFTTLVPRLLGARVVLDIHDLVPELYGSKFGGSPGHPIIRATRLVERLSTTFADHVITAGAPFRRRLVARGVPASKVTVIMNSADPHLFRSTQSIEHTARRENGFRLMYHGGLFERYGLDIAIRAVAQVRDAIPGLRFDIYGRGEATASLQQLIAELDLAEQVRLGGFVPLDRIPALVAEADLGVVPYRKNPFTDLLFPTKAFEYLVLGVPVIAARTEAVVDLFATVPDMFFDPEDPQGLAAHILDLYRHPERRRRLIDTACSAYIPYAWENQRARYVTLMRQMAAVRGAAAKPQHF